MLGFEIVESELVAFIVRMLKSSRERHSKGFLKDAKLCLDASSGRSTF